MKSILAATLAAVFASSVAHADEGMWTFDNFPAAKLRAAYGVDVTQAWLDKVRAASVRLSVGCSGSVVSGSGLVLTNNHCVSDCTHDISTPAHDYFGPGFLAVTRPEELACPGLEAEILVASRDVTAQVAAAGAGLAGAALVQARGAMRAQLEQAACGDDRRFSCEVVGLYHGGQFWLYRYRKYDDVRLVFAPGDAVGNFGGDPDNFNFPRYDLDCGFLRLYEDGKPALTPDHLRWNLAPPAAGQPVFTSGNPGPTYREETVAELETHRDVALPLEMAQMSELRGRLIRFSEENPANAALAADMLGNLENDYKETVGLLATLDDPAFMEARRAAETELRAKALAAQGPGGDDPWADMAAAQRAYRNDFLLERQLEAGPHASDLFNYARRLVRAAIERAKPPAERLPGYGDSQLMRLGAALLAPRPVSPALEQLQLEFWLSKTREALGADDPATRLLLGRDSPEALSQRLAFGSHLADPAVRRALWDGGLAAVQSSDDPMIQLALRIEPAARSARARFEDEVQGPATRAAEAIASYRFAVYGTGVYPDGTLTLRLSYGAVAGWTERSRPVAPFTTFAGLYDRATGQPPFQLDPRWTAAQDRLNAATIFNFTTTNDIVGGNSGSPVLNAKGEVIGTAFDGNLPSIGGAYGYDPAVNRTVALSAAAIDAALRKVYDAGALADELAGS